MLGFKGVGGYEKEQPQRHGKWYLLDKLTSKDDFLVESKYLGDESTYWRTFFDELHPARR
jgi:hypothetical protein